MSKPNRETIAETLNALRQHYPQAFTDPPRPLKIGIINDLLTACAVTGLSKTRIRAAIQFFTSINPYQWCMAQSGAMRIDLAGNAVEPVSDDHRQNAIEIMKARKKAKAELQKKQRQPEKRPTGKTTGKTTVIMLKKSAVSGTVQAPMVKPKPTRKGTLTLKAASA